MKRVCSGFRLGLRLGFRFGVLLLATVVTRADALTTTDATFTSDVVHARTAVPDEARKLGEVKLITRGTSTVVQSVLVTRVLPRAVAEIRLKEEANWPVGSVGRDDMQRYVAALEEAATTLRAELGPADARTAADEERRVPLLIEFRVDDVVAEVAIATFEPKDSGSPFDPMSIRILATPALARPYVLANMRLILADAFRVSTDDLARLGPLGPLTSP